MARDLAIAFVSNLVTKPLEKLADMAPAGTRWTVSHGDLGTIEQTLMTGGGADVLIVHLDHRYFFAIGVNPVERARQLVELAGDYALRNNAHVVLNTIHHQPADFSLPDYAGDMEKLAAVNRMILGSSEKVSSLSTADVAGLIARLGADNALRERNRHLMQFPYSRDAVGALMELYARHLALLVSPRKKLVLVDADNTLWRGVVGEDGPAGVGIDTDFANAAHWIFQEQLRALKASGMLLGLVTKNNPEDIEEIFRLRRMPLTRDDFIIMRSNWQPKSANIMEIAEELNLGLNSFVFIDDNPFELGEVAGRLPEVSCHRFRHDDFDAAIKLLPGMPGLRTLRLTAEDLAKTAQYRSQAERSSHARQFASTEEYIASLGIEISVSRNDESHVTRIAQLANKTNQFNLTTRRYSEAEIRAWMKKGRVYDFRVTDKFGDLGIVGVVIIGGDEIDTFLMSCRALGRGIETKILSLVCREHGGRQLSARYLPTAKNGQVADFFDRQGFRRTAASPEGTSYILDKGPADPPAIRIVEGPHA